MGFHCLFCVAFWVKNTDFKGKNTMKKTKVKKRKNITKRAKKTRVKREKIGKKGKNRVNYSEKG